VSILFGLSTNIYQATLARLCLGLLASVLLVAKTIISEIPSDKEKKAQAISYLSLQISIGKLGSNLLGCFLSNP
jgi:MFS family permease